jgi:hypothetical protein
MSGWADLNSILCSRRQKISHAHKYSTSRSNGHDQNSCFRPQKTVDVVTQGLDPNDTPFSNKPKAEAYWAGKLRASLLTNSEGWPNTGIRHEVFHHDVSLRCDILAHNQERTKGNCRNLGIPAGYSFTRSAPFLEFFIQNHDNLHCFPSSSRSRDVDLRGLCFDHVIYQKVELQAQRSLDSGAGGLQTIVILVQCEIPACHENVYNLAIFNDAAVTIKTPKEKSPVFINVVNS